MVLGEEGNAAKGDYGRKAEEARNTSCMRDGRKKGACVSLLSPHRAQRRVNLSTKTSPVRTNTPKQTLACQPKPLFAASLSLFFPSLPHNTARTEHILLQTTVRRVCLPLQHDTERDERERGEEEEKRRALFKEPGGRNLCGCGRNTPPSFSGFFFFFFITEGKQGPPQSLPHHHKYGGEMCVGRNAQEKKTGEENNMAGKREGL